MAYVKHTAIHTTPKAHLKYILNPEKNEKMKYVTGICCGDELETAYDNFKEIFEKYNDENFDNCEISKKSGKKHIRIHSYTQSFDSGVSAEEAHRIGVEWAKKVFGENRPIIVSTHSNTIIAIIILLFVLMILTEYAGTAITKHCSSSMKSALNIILTLSEIRERKTLSAIKNMMQGKRDIRGRSRWLIPLTGSYSVMMLRTFIHLSKK